MGIFRRVGEWLTERSDHFIRGDATVAGGYYGTPEAEKSYGGMGARQGEDGEADGERVDTQPFGHGAGEYGGRVPYRSRYDVEREAQEAAYREAQEAQQREAAQRAAWQRSQQAQQAQPQPQGYGYQQQPAQGAQPQPAQQAQQVQQAQQPQGNVVPFPGTQQSADGAYFAHVEYVVSIHSRNECKDVIAYMKANASVFLNMEFIASDSERQRCVDLLSGAAYTLGCKLNKISLRGVYLISSPSVRVILDSATQRFSGAPESQGYARQPYEAQGYAYQQEPRQAGAGFSSGSPTTRFQQAAQQGPPASFGNVMAGGGYAQAAYARQQ